jgi:release factor glutamine methyltransferase
VDVGPREAQWIIEAARDDAHALEMARRRAGGEPLQYITGEAYFRRLKLAVGPGVLIPRPETELVTERAMAHLPQGGTLVDIGTGSGAIALAIKNERPDATVYATENAPAALTWARRNIAEQRLEVALIEGDLFDGLSDNLRGKLDVVVANLPYVATGDTESLPIDVGKHEPPEALFAGPDGLALVRRIADEARGWLNPGGWLVLEIGETQGEMVRDLLEGETYQDVTIGVDLARWPRIAEGKAP